MIFWGIGGTFLYNYFASLLRAVGNSATPLVFLGVSAVLNIVLDLVFVVVVPWGVARGGLCHQLFPVGVWGGAAGVHLEAHGSPAPQPPGRLLEKGQGGGDCPVLPALLRAAAR